MLCEMAKIAGIESTANTKSVNSIIINAKNKGVATLFQFSIVKNLSVFVSFDTGIIFLTVLTINFFSKSTVSSLSSKSIFTAVNNKNTQKT
jgi:hypothetical protein